MAKTWNIKRVSWMAVACCTLAAEQSAYAADSGGRAPRDEGRVESREVKRGRSVIFRAGELPRVLPKMSEPAGGAIKPPLPTHYLDTTLPVLIQGAPHEFSLQRYVTTG